MDGSVYVYNDMTRQWINWCLKTHFLVHIIGTGKQAIGWQTICYCACLYFAPYSPNVKIRFGEKIYENLTLSPLSFKNSKQFHRFGWFHFHFKNIFVFLFICFIMLCYICDNKQMLLSGIGYSAQCIMECIFILNCDTNDPSHDPPFACGWLEWLMIYINCI